MADGLPNCGRGRCVASLFDALPDDEAVQLRIQAPSAEALATFAARLQHEGQARWVGNVGAARIALHAAHDAAVGEAHDGASERSRAIKVTVLRSAVRAGGAAAMAEEIAVRVRQALCEASGR